MKPSTFFDPSPLRLYRYIQHKTPPSGVLLPLPHLTTTNVHYIQWSPMVLTHVIHFSTIRLLYFFTSQAFIAYLPSLLNLIIQLFCRFFQLNYIYHPCMCVVFVYFCLFSLLWIIAVMTDSSLKKSANSSFGFRPWLRSGTAQIHHNYIFEKSSFLFVSHIIQDGITSCLSQVFLVFNC